MNYKHCCVIDRQGYYVTNVLVHLEQNDQGALVDRIDTYILGTGESIIETSVPSGMLAPRWNGSIWVETATPEQIEAAKPEPPPPAPPSDLELLATEFSTMMAMMQEQNDLAIADLTMLMAAGMGV